MWPSRGYLLKMSTGHGRRYALQIVSLQRHAHVTSQGRRAIQQCQPQTRLERRSPTVGWIYGLQRTILENAYQIAVHVGRTLKTSKHCQTPHRDSAKEYAANALYTIPGEAKSPRIWKCGYLQNVVAKGHRSAQTISAAPIVFTLKKDWFLRFCERYRKPNVVTKRDLYPIPQMEECTDFLGEAVVFFTLDTNSAYRKVEVEKTDQNETTFKFHHRLVPLRTNSFWLNECSKTVSARDGYYPVTI